MAQSKISAEMQRYIDNLQDAFPKHYIKDLRQGAGRGKVLCLIIDGSGSMGTVLSNVQQSLRDLGHVLAANGITHIAYIIFSDYDRGSFIDLDASTVAPWFTNIIESPDWNRSMTPVFIPYANNSAAFLKAARAHRSIDKGLVDMWEIMIGSCNESQDAPTDAKKVFMGSFGDINTVIKEIGQFSAGRTLGSGGDRDEAHPTSLLAALAALGGGAHVIFMGDASPHISGASLERKREQDTLRKMGLPWGKDYVRKVFEMAYLMGARVSILNSGPDWTAGVADFPGNMVANHCNLGDKSFMLAALANTLAFFMTGKSQLPMTPTPGQLMAIGIKLMLSDNAAVMGAIGPHIQFGTTQCSVYEPAVGTFPMLRIDMSDKEANDVIFRAFMALLKENPILALILGPLAAPFFKAKGSLGDDINDEWQSFTTGLARQHGVVVAALFNEMFVAARLSNTDELGEALYKMYKMYEMCKMVRTQGQLTRVIVYTGDPLPHDTFQQFGLYLTQKMGVSLLAAVDKFKILTEEEAIALGHNLDNSVPLLARTYLPAWILESDPSGQFLNLVWALAMENATMPPKANAFKLSCVLLANATHLTVIPELRLAAYRFVFGEANYMKYLAFLLDDDFVPREDKNPLISGKWWFQPMALNILVKVLETFNATVSPDKVDRIRLLQKIVALVKRRNDELSIGLEQSTLTFQKAGRVVMCHAGHWMPETLFGPDGCVYCIGIHPPNTEENRENRFNGQTFHGDGTPHLTPDPELKTVVIDSAMDTVCSNCECHYSVLDKPITRKDGSKRGYGNFQPRCWNCRSRRDRTMAPIRTCQQCNAKWVFGTPSEDWSCVYCEYGDKLASSTTYAGTVTTTVTELALGNSDVLEGIAASYGLTPSFVKMLLIEYQGGNNFLEVDLRLLGFIRSDLSKLMTVPTQPPPESYVFGIPTGKRIKSTCWPFDKHTSPDGQYAIANAQEIQSLLSTLMNNSLRGECNLGLCDSETHPVGQLVSLCGACSYCSCRGCLRKMTQCRTGTVVPVMRLVCPCGRGICQKALDTIHKKGHLTTTLAAECAAHGKLDGRLGLCLGAHHLIPGTVDTYQVMCRHQRVTVLPPYTGVCGADNPDDDVDNYRCRECAAVEDTYDVRQAEIRNAREREEAASQAVRDDAMIHTKADIEEVMKAYPPGTTFRKCPGCEKQGQTNYATFDNLGACSHMQCGKCKHHWCWLCRADFTTAADCYAHMNSLDGGYDYNDDDDDEDFRVHRNAYGVSADAELSNTDDVIIS